MEKERRKRTEPDPETQLQLGSSALLFIDPSGNASYLENPSTYLGDVVEEEIESDALDHLSDEIKPSYAQSREDYQLLRRAQRSRSNRTKRADRKRR